MAFARQVHLCSSLRQQHLGGGDVAAGDGSHQRGGAAHVLPIDSGPGLDERPHAGVLAHARRVEQGGGVVLVGKVDRGAELDEGLDHVGVAALRGPHERADVPVVRVRVDVAAPLEQRKDDVHVPAFGRHRHRRRAALRRALHVGAVAQQLSHLLRVAVDGRLVQRRVHARGVARDGLVDQPLRYIGAGPGAADREQPRDEQDQAPAPAAPAPVVAPSVPAAPTRARAPLLACERHL